MNWQFLNWLLAIFFLATVSLAEAQPAKKVARIGYLANTAATSAFSQMPFRERLRELGYIEGRISRSSTGILKVRSNDCQSLSPSSFASNVK